ncbi:MAG: HupE/UreJ family protein [Pseudolabrys sp.]
MRMLLAILVQMIIGSSAMAHELRPAYLDMRETATNEFAVLWKVPALDDLRLGLYVRLPDVCKAKTETVRTIHDGAYFERWSVACPNGLKGQEIVIDGLRSTVTDALARIEYRDGTKQIARFTPEKPTLLVASGQSGLEVAETYFLLGVDHILTGFDHLLFVLALLLLIHDRWMLVKTVTAFTIAHSITLAGATLGYISLPQKPVEATIALSIAFVASELVKARSGERRLSEDYPWIVAFVFGLLHGFGFAGALKETGLPQTDISLALLTFNLGVEAGQLTFIAAALVVFRAASILVTVPIAPARLSAAYLIGTTSMVWLVARFSSFGI